VSGKRKDLTLSIVMGVLVVFALYYFLIRPQRSTLDTARAQRQDVEQTLSAAQRELVTPSPTAAGAEPADASGIAIPAEPRLAELLRQLQTIGQESGVTQQSVSPSPLGANPSGAGGSLQITISASGTHSAVAMYLQKIRDLERLAVIEQVGVDTAPGASTDHVQLSLRVFTQQGPVAMTAAAP
jgi:Tfp pilus assembly protein PilO